MFGDPGIGETVLTFAPNGRLLASGSINRKEGLIHLWDWRDPCLEQPRRLGPNEIDRLWADLAAEDAAPAYRAIATLRALPQQAVHMLAERLQPIGSVTPAQLERLITDLEDDCFPVREQAYRRLEALGEAARPALQRALAGKPSPEVKRRVEMLLGQLEGPPSPGQLRCLRAVEVLECVGTAEAQQVLQKLAGGAPGAVETEDARAALQRSDANRRSSQTRTDAPSMSKGGVRSQGIQLRHGGRVCSAAFAPDGKTLVSAGPGQPLRLWDTTSGKELRQFTGHLTGALAVDFSPDGQLVASGGCYGDGTIRLWEAATGKQIRLVRVPEGGVMSVTWAPDGRLLASARGGEVELWDMNQGARLRQWRCPVAVEVVRFSPCGKYLAGGGGDGAVILWDLARGEGVRYLQGHKGHVRSLAFAPDGKTLASGGHGGAIYLWEAATGKVRSQWKNSAVSFALAFAPGGQMLASADGTTVSLWSIPTGRELGRFETNGSQVVAFSPTGKVLAVGASTSVALRELTSLPVADQQGHPREPLTAQQFHECWHELAGDDAQRAHEAIWAFVRTPGQAVAFLRERLQPVPPPDQQRVRQLLSELDSDDFTVREKATGELERIGDSATPMLQQTLVGRPTPEVRRRVEQLLEKFGRPDTSVERLRVLRAIEVLEHIATPEVGRVLQTLAGGVQEALATREAAAAAKRLAERPDRRR